jgi:hypothetical protein
VEGRAGKLGDAVPRFKEVLVEESAAIDLTVVLAEVRPRKSATVPCRHFSRKRFLDRAPDIAYLAAGLLLTGAKATIVGWLG